MDTILLELEKVRRVYPEFALEASFAVSRGEFFSILGPSGSGKTTLLRLVAGFDQPDDGRIVLAGDDITAVPPHRRRIGMVFQDYALFPHLSVGANVAYGLKMKGMPPRQRRDRVVELLALTGLAGFYDRDPSSLSGGEKQRVAVARALAPEPLVLLMDEPFSALDQTLRKHLRREIKELQRAAGITTLFVTHSQEEALTLSDRMLVMATGCVEQVGTPEEVYRHPGSPNVACFLGEMNRLPARVSDGGRLLSLNGRTFVIAARKAWPDGSGLLCFRSEECEVRTEPGAEPAVPVTILAREFAGPWVVFTVSGSAWQASAMHLGSQVPSLRPGDTAWLAVLMTRAVFVRTPVWE